jgi:hypothetical protein
MPQWRMSIVDVRSPQCFAHRGFAFARQHIDTPRLRVRIARRGARDVEYFFDYAARNRIMRETANRAARTDGCIDD